MDEINLDIPHENYSSFELTLCLRDRDGNPTGKHETIKSFSAVDISDFWLRHQIKPKKLIKNKKRRRGKGKGKSQETIPNAKEADKILRYLNRERDSQE